MKLESLAANDETTITLARAKTGTVRYALILADEAGRPLVRQTSLVGSLD